MLFFLFRFDLSPAAAAPPTKKKEKVSLYQQEQTYWGSLSFAFKVIETDDSFEPLSDGWDYLVDFLDLSFPTQRPEREHAYLEVRRAPC